jgi:excisionase family DNA binding protein
MTDEHLLDALRQSQQEIIQRLDRLEASLSRSQPEYLSIRRAAQLASLSYDHVRRAVENGELPATDKGKGKKRVFRIARADFERWMRSGREPIPARSELKDKVNRYLPGLVA